MEHFVFVSGNEFKSEYFDTLLTFDKNYSEWFEVALANEDELRVLLKLLDINNIQETDLTKCEDFKKLYSFSLCKLPEHTQESFDQFYEIWLANTGRESSMDEYG